MNDLQFLEAREPPACPPALLPSLLHALPMAAYVCDADGWLLQWNARAEVLWGRAPRPGPGGARYCGAARCLGADGEPLSLEALPVARLLRSRQEQPVTELVLEAADGARRRVLLQAALLDGEATSPRAALVTLTELSVPLHAEHRLYGVIERMDDYIAQIDQEGRFRFVTRKAAASIGRRPEELVGRTLEELFGTAGRDYGERLQHVMAAGRSGRFEHYYEAYDRWYDSHVYPNENGVLVFAEDITARKLAERHLRQTERLHQALLELIPVGMYWCEAASGAIRYYNRQAAELWGRQPRLGTRGERYCGAHRLCAQDGTVLGGEGHPMAAALKEGRSLRQAEMLLERPDGSRITVLVTIEPVRSRKGRIVGAIAVFQDISERKLAEELRSQMAAIVESSQEAIISKDLQGRVRFWNAAAERLYGYAAAEMLGQPASPLYPPDRVNEEEEIFARILAGERIENFETVRLTRSGTAVEVSMTISPVREPTGRIIGLSSLAHDISERKSHERALRDSEARYRALVEGSGGIVFSADRDGRWKCPVPGWEAYTGQAFGEHRGYGWLRAVHPDDRPLVRVKAEEALLQDRPLAVEMRVWHRASQDYRHHEARAVPVFDGCGLVREWVGLSMDIHARKAAEEAVRDTDRRKDEFLAVLAHELRNPLAPLVTSLQILRLPQAVEMHAAAIDVMDRQMHHLVRLVDDLMEVARITRGSIELRKELLRLDEVVSAAVEISRPTIDARLHQLVIQPAPEPIKVYGDRVRLTQIIANLLNNAARYTPTGGRIDVSAESQQGEALVHVCDNGIGFDARQKERIFELFTRANPTREYGAGGLGIGLGLSRRLAELHEGSVQGSSPGPGLGSRFTLRLPLALALDLPSSAAAGLRDELPRQRVLVLDDNHDAAAMLAALLRSLGQDVRVAHSGTEALALAEQFRPALALLDLGMAPPDGFAVARALRRRAGGARITLIAVTGWGQDADRQRSREAGFDLHLVKPVSLEAVREALKTGVFEGP